MADFWRDGKHKFYSLPNRSVVEGVHPVLASILDRRKAVRVLDFGCGNGALLERLRRPDRTLIGYDVSQKALRIARAKLGVAASLTGDMAMVEDGSMDAITSCMVLMSASSEAELDRLCLAAAQKLKPGGCFVAAVTHPCFRQEAFTDFSVNWGRDRSYFKEAQPFQVRLFDEENGYVVSFEDYHYSLSRVISAHIKSNLKIASLIEVPDSGCLTEPQNPLSGPLVPAFLVIESTLA